MSKGDLKLFGKKLNRPGKFPLEEIKKALSSLYYEEKTLTAWKKKEPVFLKQNIGLAASLIQKVLMKLKPQNKIAFSISGSTRKTTGNLFVKNNLLIFRFNTIHGIPYLHDTFSVKSEAEAEVLTNWRLFPGPGQQFFSSRGFLGLQKKQKNMIALKVKKNKEKKKNVYTAVEDKKPIPQDNKRKTAENKLRYLKELKDKNLISEKAYETKVQSLLDQL